VKDGHVKDGHVKDTAEDVAEDVALDEAKDVFGAAEDGSTRAFVVALVIFQRRNPRPTHACHPPTPPLGDT